jgi:hypothetical protein
MLAAITPATRVVFIANPNNPTGTFIPGPSSRPSWRACRPTCWWCSTRPTPNTWRRTSATTRSAGSPASPTCW